MTTIYRKYRPQTFSDVSGQDHVVKTIINEIASEKIAHAYLFSGPRGTGKTTMARLLAKAVNCQNRKKNEPCNECSSCREITAGNNIDVIEIDAASHTGVDNVRENIIENAQFKPTRSPFKIFIIDEVHMLSTSAFNALLKTLEEPPSHVIFILATTEPHKLLATIISRCQRFNFKKVGYEEMKKRLEKICKEEEIKVDQKIIDRVINKSDGCLRDAESLLGQIFSLNLKNIEAEDAETILPTSDIQTLISFVDSIVGNQPTGALNIIKTLTEEGVNLEQFAFDVLEILRLMMIIQIDARGKNIQHDFSDADFMKIKNIATKITDKKIVRMIESLLIRKRDIKIAPIPQLPLELFIIEFSDENSDDNSLNGPAAKKNTETKKETAEDKPRAQTITQTIKETISHIRSHHQITTTAEQIKEKWADLIAKISEQNHSLTFILKMSEIKSVDSEGLHITVPYSFHQDKINDLKNKKLIEARLNDMFSEKILLNCDVNSSQQPKTEEDLNNLAADFGGEIVV